MPAFGDPLGLHCTSIGSRPCGACLVRRCSVGAVGWSTDSFQLAANHLLIFWAYQLVAEDMSDDLATQLMNIRSVFIDDNTTIVL